MNILTSFFISDIDDTIIAAVFITIIVGGINSAVAVAIVAAVFDITPSRRRLFLTVSFHYLSSLTTAVRIFQRTRIIIYYLTACHFKYLSIFVNIGTMNMNINPHRIIIPIGATATVMTATADIFKSSYVVEDRQ